MKEIAQYYCGRRILYGVGQGQIVVGAFFTLTDKVGQLWLGDSQGINLLTQLIDQCQLGVLVRLQEPDVKPDHPGPIARQQVHQSRDLGPRPGPASFRSEALFIDQRHHDRWRGLQLPAREEPQVVGFQFD